MPDIITSYEDLVKYTGNMISIGRETLFWVIEYNKKNPDFTEAERYSLLRNECLKYPQNFKDRLNNGIYKIWTRTPY